MFVSVDDARLLAHRRLPQPIFDYLEGGGGAERTVAANRAALERVAFVPRVAVDVSQRDLATSVFGTDLALPVVLAPTTLNRLFHPDGELAAARAAAAVGTVIVLSTSASVAVEDVASAGPTWFQLYLGTRDGAEPLLTRVEKAGVQVLVLTVDVPMQARRDRDLRNALVYPPPRRTYASWTYLRHPGWTARALSSPPIGYPNMAGLPARSGLNPALQWDDVQWLARRWPGPLVVKGISHADDARRAIDCGAAGIIVSNHGGRQLDGAVGTLDALPFVIDAVGGAVPVLFDGGIRRGGDVVAALALGATACLIGRAYCYGLAVAGEQGVAAVLEILRDEIDRTLALLGRTKIAELDESVFADQTAVEKETPS
ncbi:MAG: alpha-hydroxy-acid oxidizing protein [Actinobacteria bacterium]|nr:MAG: alpha-hydroxy-acid oxidizing protein [Actinomycetota bacterium]